MIVKVMHRTDRDIVPVTYSDVAEVKDVFNDYGVFCHQLIMEDGTTATFPACEWSFWEWTWKEMF